MLNLFLIPDTDSQFILSKPPDALPETDPEHGASNENEKKDVSSIPSWMIHLRERKKTSVIHNKELPEDTNEIKPMRPKWLIELEERKRGKSYGEVTDALGKSNNMTLKDSKDAKLETRTSKRRHVSVPVDIPKFFGKSPDILKSPVVVSSYNFTLNSDITPACSNVKLSNTSNTSENRTSETLPTNDTVSNNNPQDIVDAISNKKIETYLVQDTVEYCDKKIIVSEDIKNEPRENVEIRLSNTETKDSRINENEKEVSNNLNVTIETNLCHSIETSEHDKIITKSAIVDYSITANEDDHEIKCAEEIPLQIINAEQNECQEMKIEFLKRFEKLENLIEKQSKDLKKIKEKLNI